MTAPLWVGLALFAFGAIAILRFRLSPPQQLAAAVLAAAVGFALARQFALALPVAALGVGLWRRAAAGAIPRRDARSSVESSALRMTLDHATGGIDGEVTAGSMRGARLSKLSTTELQSLAAEFETAGDEESLALLLAYLDRRSTARAASPPPDQAPMTEAEAYRVLGLAPGASLEEVRTAYRRLMKRVHPDLGGSSALAALLNAAKEILDPG
jgi:HAMP domain-containing protein